MIEFLIAAVTATVITAVLIPLAPRLGLIDAPSERKVHERPTPRGGGIAIYLGALLGVVVLRPSELLQNTGLILFGIGGVIALVGLIDDRRSLPWQIRISAQFLAAIAAVMLGLSESPWPLQVFAVLWIVGLTNAFNMLDNMDMLSAGTAWIATAALIVIFAANEVVSVHYCWPLLGALTGFLWFNRPPARIFMGDVGSTFLGFFLAFSTLDLIRPTSAPVSWLTPLVLLAVPCYDMTSVVLIRLRQGRSPFHADKQHLSHRLAALGLSRPLAVTVIHGLALLSGIAAILLTRTNNASDSWLVIAAFVAGWSVFITFDIAAALRRRREKSP